MGISWWLPQNLPSRNVFSLGFTSELTAFIVNPACSLVFLPWVSAAFSSCGEFMTPVGEGDFDFSDTSDILFEVSAFSTRETVLATFPPVRGGADVGRLLMLRANVTFICWHPVFFGAVVGNV